MRSLSRLSILVAAAFCAAAPAAATRLILADNQGDCLQYAAGLCGATMMPSVADAGPAHASRDDAHGTPPDFVTSPTTASGPGSEMPSSTLRGTMNHLPEAVTWALLVSGFTIIGFSLRGSHNPMRRVGSFSAKQL